jgi:hypothetical protein
LRWLAHCEPLGDGTVSRWAQAAGDSHKLRTDSIRLHGRNHQPARDQTQHRSGGLFKSPNRSRWLAHGFRRTRPFGP